MTNFYNKLWLGLLLLLALGCISRVRTIDSRKPHFYKRIEGGKIFKDPMKSPPNPSKKQVFTRKKDVKIIPLPNNLMSGSLYNANDKNNELFTTFNPPRISDFLIVKVVNHKTLGGGADGNNESQGELKDSNSVLDEEQLVKSLPSLEPADLKSKGILKNLKMKLVHRFPNGDLLLSYNRESFSNESKVLLKVKARLPAQFIKPDKDITTSHLADVVFVEISENELINKKSTSWEDEYTLRISGFSEAESKVAAELDVKRRELMGIKEQLENRLKSLGSERRQMAKEREKWIKSNKQADQKITEANQKVEEQKQLLQEKDSQLREKTAEIEALTRPEDKPENNETF